MIEIAVFIFIFASGEGLANRFWFAYLKRHFGFTENATVSNVDGQQSAHSKRILTFDLSTFKGMMERLLMYLGLILGFTPILVVFGTIKLGTRFKDSQEIKNDYFLIGNFSSILISMLYYFCYVKGYSWILKL